MKTIRLCQACGLPLPPDAPEGLCPQCLLKSDLPTLTQGDGVSTPVQPAQPRPSPGRTFGGYRILRLLGQGGMGEVYEAEHIETGRRMALKVMSHTLASDQDRKRFIREGRLAAAVNHPNVVYIHGSEEIAGAPVIAMELVQGGTLKDCLKREGPLPVARAVEAALQIIAGLEGAEGAGVLHRDIKPANCFVDADGTIKIGDFGLSVSTLARGESLLTATGSVLGTPAYASPEQLRGEELDVKSDIYSAGATLYHLLTGRTPFRATDFVKLITEVLDKQPEAPHTVRSEVPAELSRIVLRCLAKDRKARYQTYEELRKALLPFCATEAVPAPPARRFLAGLLDEVVAYGPSLFFLVYWSFDPLDNLVRERTLRSVLVWLPFLVWYLLYYAVTEGRWGAGLGKTVCGLRVAGHDRQAPGLGRALLRAGIYVAPSIVPAFLLMAMVPLAQMRAALARGEVLVTDWLWLPLLLLLFATMRRRNGYAAIQDLWSGTRVIMRPQTQPRPALVQAVPSFASGSPCVQRPEGTGPVQQPPVLPRACEVTRAPECSGVGISTKLGPYQINTLLWRMQEGELFLALDPVLRRKIWIHVRALDARPVSPARRDLNRPARLRWLNGGRNENQLWDAYEAVEGAPLLALGEEPKPWRAVRCWLLDLAEEMSAALKDAATVPTLALDRVWIAANGRALLLDFICPGFPNDPAHSATMPLKDVADMQRFLELVANEALRGVTRGTGGETKGQVDLPSRLSAPLAALPSQGRGEWAQVPLHARSFLASLAGGSFEQAEFIVGNLHSLATKAAEVTRAWRAASLALAPAVILLFGFLLAAMVNFERIRGERRWADLYPGKPSLQAAARVYSDAIDGLSKGEATAQGAEAIRAYLVNHFGDLLTNETFWANPDLGGTFSKAERTLLQQAATGHGAPTAAAGQEAEQVVSARIDEEQRQERSAAGWVFIGLLLCGAGAVWLIELLGSGLFRQSPILRLFGIAVVDRNGQPANRLRLLWRWTVVWVPTMGLGLVMAALAALALAVRTYTLPIDPRFNNMVPIFAVLLMAAAGVLLLGVITYAGLRPERSLQDRLAGTRLVAR